MKKTKNHPGVIVPPPIFYALFFLLSTWLQQMSPLDRQWLSYPAVRALGWLIIAIGIFFNVMALARFIRTRNTVVTIKPARSLVTNGIYSITRNPMYLALLLLYTGLAFFFGNSWTFLLLPILLLVIDQFVIRKEENYLKRAFGDQYLEYSRRVRRWI